MSTEPFPELTPVSSSVDYSQPAEVRVRRKKEASLGEGPRGDTAAPALATLYDHSPSPSTFNSPVLKSSSDKSRKSKTRRVRSLFKRWKHMSLKHTWVNPLVICLAVLFIYACNPSPSNPVYPAIFLSYPLPREATAGPDEPIQYGKGAKDFAFVAFYTVFLSFTREFTMQRLLRPLAIMYGIKSRGKQARYMEQAYTAIYFFIFGPYGLYVMSRSPVWYFNTEAMYEGFPHRTHEALFKAYYLLQASYWAQQMIVLLLMQEKPRKDFKELVAHHFITIALIWCSYRFHFTRMGLAVYITMDISDFFLATSKVLNYIDSIFVVPYFVFFIGTWVYLRHYQNLRFLFSILPLSSPFPDHITEQWHGVVATIYTTLRTYLDPIIIRPFEVLFPQTASLIASGSAFLYTWWNTPSEFESVGSFTLDWDTQQYKCWISQWITFGLLAALQAVNIFWLYFIVRILWRAVVSLGQERVDERSESDSDEETEVDETEKPVFVDTGKPSAEAVADQFLNGNARKH